MIKNKRKLHAILSVIIIASLITGVTYAWFFINRDVELEYASDIVCESGTSLELSIDNGETWSGRVVKSGTSSKLMDISGNGVNLFRPKMLDETNQPIGFDIAEVIDSQGYGDYIEFNVDLRSTSAMNVYLSGDSFINPKSTDSDDVNIFGKFSKDYIAGAMRVAILEKVDDTEVLKMIWAPNPTFMLTRNQNGTYNFTPEGVMETSYSYYTGDSYYTVTKDDYANKQFIYGSTNATPYMANSSPILTTLNPATGYYDIKTLIIRIWFEGTDREADQALSGGCTEMNIKFSGIQKAPASEQKQQEIDALAFDDANNVITGLNTNMVFSEDGFNWKQYDGSNLPDLSMDFTLYFKYPETVDTFETNYKKIEKNN